MFFHRTVIGIDWNRNWILYEFFYFLITVCFNNFTFGSREMDLFWHLHTIYIFIILLYSWLIAFSKFCTHIFLQVFGILLKEMFYSSISFDWNRNWILYDLFYFIKKIVWKSVQQVYFCFLNRSSIHRNRFWLLFYNFLPSKNYYKKIIFCFIKKLLYKISRS